MTEAPAVRLFVYGTLRRGGTAEGLLAGGRWLRDARVAGSLYAVGGRFPALVLDGAGEVHGEVWGVPASLLPALDRYEGAAEGLFRRARTEIDGEACWIYLAGPALLPRLGEADRVPDGRWGA